MTDIKAAGATLVAISPQREQYSRQIAKQHQLTFDVLSDEGNPVAEQFGLKFKLPDDLKALYQKLGADLERFDGDDSWTLPMPGQFIIDRSGVILAREVDPDYTVRPEPSWAIEQLRARR